MATASSSSWRKRSSPGAGLTNGGYSSSDGFANSLGSQRDVSETQDMTESQHQSADAQEIMKDNLEIMREIVMRIREDPEFAASIYADCPRLQHQLDLRPDLRPIFEDPNLVRINFEQVYREAGGKLPEDEVEEKKKLGLKVILAKIVHSPFFKVLRVLLLIKKIVNCATGNGVSMIRGLFSHMCCHTDAVGGGGGNGVDADGHHVDADGNPDSPGNAETKAALNKVAEHMEDPQVQEHMNELLQNDPDGLDQAIQNDPDLRALRDSNPLCAELMKDPDTMRILVDPDNLRALGDCPDLIQQDFADPNWLPPDLETGGGGFGGVDAMGGGVGVDNMHDYLDVNADGGGVDLNGDGIPDADYGDFDAPDTDAANVGYPDMGPPDVGSPDVGSPDVGSPDVGSPDAPDAPDADGGVDGGADAGADADGGGDGGNLMDSYDMGNNNNQGGPQMPGQGGGGFKGVSRSRNRGDDENPNQSRIRGFATQIGAGLTDMVAAQIVGFGMGEFMPGGDAFDALGNLDGMDTGGLENVDTSGMEGAADQAAIAADGASQNATSALGSLENSAVMLNNSYGNQLDYLEKGMDTIEEHAEVADVGTDRSAAMGATEGAALGAGVVGANGTDQGRGVDEEEQNEGKSRSGWMSNFASSLATAAKESVASAFLGDDLGELLVEKQEERSERAEEDRLAKRSAKS